MRGLGGVVLLWYYSVLTQQLEVFRHVVLIVSIWEHCSGGLTTGRLLLLCECHGVCSLFKQHELVAVKSSLLWWGWRSIVCAATKNQQHGDWCLLLVSKSARM